MKQTTLLVLATMVLSARPGLAQARVVSAPTEPSLLNLTSAWARASMLGDLREMRTRSDHLELRVWRGFGSDETQTVVLRRTDGQWSAFLATVIRCEIQIPASVADTASPTTMRAHVAAARRSCGTPIVGVTAGARIITADTLVVRQLDVAESEIGAAWRDALSAGVLQLPGRVSRSSMMLDGVTYVVEVRRGDEYRAAEIEHLEVPAVKADSQVQQVNLAVRRLLPRR
jgi:hypothetical protein